MKRLTVLAGAAMLMGATCSADAAIYNVTLSSANYGLSAQVTTDNTNVITAISGNVSGLYNAAISGLAFQFNTLYTSDNVFTPSSTPYVSNEGVLFTAGAYYFNIYSVLNGSSYDYYFSSNQFSSQYANPFFEDPVYNPGSLIVTGTIAAVPELSTWIMMLVGFAGIGVAGTRRGGAWRNQLARREAATA